jgi:branched-subunit amino acid transport protein
MNSWLLIIFIAVGTFIIRLSFFELWGGKTVPAWLKQVLKYVPPAVVAAIVFPLCVASPATDTFGWPEFDTLRVIAGTAAFIAGLVLSRSMFWPILTGMAVLWGLQALLQ